MPSIIQLTQGKVTLVNPEHFAYLNQYRWWYDGKGYAMRSLKEGKIFLHRELMFYLGYNICGKEIDHRDRNGLNNTKNNLRVSTHQQNSMNRGPNKNNTSGFKGVFYCRDTFKWRAKIMYKGTNFDLGRYSTRVEAAISYDRWAIELNGDRCHLNILEHEGT